MSRRVELSWLILKAKYWYYVKDQPIMADYDYDLIEKEYDQLCQAEGASPTASDMVGFDEKRPSCQIVMAKEEGIEYPDFQRTGASRVGTRIRSKR